MSAATDLEVTHDFAGLASVTYPHGMHLKLGLGGKTINISDKVIKGFFVLGVASLAYHVKDIFKLTRSLAFNVYGTVRCLFKELKTEGTAVLYGTGTGIGKAFAKKFVEQKMTVILVDFDAEGLNRMKEEFIKENGAFDDQVICYPIKKPGEGSEEKHFKDLSAILKKQKQVTYFVNCMGAKSWELGDLNKKKTQEVMYMCYSMTSVYAVLLKKVLKIMCEQGCGQIIHLNTTYENKELKETHPLLLACMMFAEKLTRLLKCTYKKKGICFMNIKTKYDTLIKIEDYSPHVRTCLLKAGLFENICI
jgi:NADP-dependent 3-hydroxy acid dehydrogenase YdfG